jgi:phosphotriesterase-related protein
MTRAAAARLALLALLVALAPAASRPRTGHPAAIPDLSGKILTVTGPVDPADFGVTLMHEHLVIVRETLAALRFRAPEERVIYDEPLSLANLAAHRNARAYPDRDSPYNTDDLTSVEDAIEETLYFKRLGGSALVDVTNIGLNRNPEALRRVAEATGLRIVMGSGCYRHDFILSLDIEGISEEALADRIVEDIVTGAEGTAIRSGIIGEVGIQEDPVAPVEIKSLRASARASRRTGAAITLHGGGAGEEKFRVLDALVGRGADPARVVFGHSNNVAQDPALMERLLARGVYVQFDLLGMSIGSRLRPLGSVNDAAVARAVVALVRAGHLDRILLSQDVCTKLQLKKFGGRGYSYMMEHFLPELRRLGLTDAEIRRITVENPRRVLTFAAPMPGG